MGVIDRVGSSMDYAFESADIPVLVRRLGVDV
jgi:hypothetical protein